MSIELENLVEYVLLAAGQLEFKERQLGITAITKLLYFGDLTYSESRGHTLSGLPWQFYHFGPWAGPIREAVDDVVQKNRVDRNEFNGRESWTWRDERRFEELDAKIPGVFGLGVKRALREYRNNAPDLIRAAYITNPMVTASPGDILEFLAVVRRDEPKSTTQLTAKQKKRLNQASLRVREKLANMFDSRFAEPVLSPSQQERLNDGLAWLEELAMDPEVLSGEQIRVHVDDSVWQSEARSVQIP